MERSVVVRLLEVVAWLVLVPGFVGGLVLAFTGQALAEGLTLSLGSLATFALMRGAAEGLRALLDIRAATRRGAAAAEREAA